MTDFMVRMFTDYPWMAPLTIVLAVAGLAYVSLWVAGLSAFASDWIAYRRAVLAYKTAVRRRLEAAPCEVCELAEEEISQLERDAGPPEYQHPDGDDDPLPEPDEDAVEAFLAAVKAMGLLEEERIGPPVCEDPECDKYGWVHPPPCLILPTMPVPKYTTGPAMPPQPVRDFLHPAIRADLAAAGFSDHETNEGALDSTFTRAQAMEVQARMRELER